MTADGRFGTAGLIFTRFRDLDIVRIANHAVNGLEALGHRVERTQILSDTSAMVIAADHEIHLATEEDVALPSLPMPAATFLSVWIPTGAPRTASAFARDSLIARILQSLHDELQPDFVKWIDTDVVLTTEDFAGATGHAPEAGAAPGSRQSGRFSRLPDIEETNEILQQRLSDQDPAIFEAQSAPDRVRKAFAENAYDPAVYAEAALEDDIEDDDIEQVAPRRLSAWLISIAVAAFSLPVGIALLVINLLKGENLRLASQTAALTGTFIGLQAYGSTAQAMGVIQGLLY
ncbi:hypothetical protein [Roseovarius salis]|uniref:hypothetical protein n=1 Tax=Roseovarius salis TaxID=3376063 RepID=UPI0037CB61FD